MKTTLFILALLSLPFSAQAQTFILKNAVERLKML